MGDKSYILEGIESEESKKALYSTIHGAGRIMSRTQASGKRIWKNGKKVQISEGIIKRYMMDDWVKEEDVELRGAGTDESPHCYKRIDQVLKHHLKTVRVHHMLTPIGVAMAGDDVEDPYKD